MGKSKSKKPPISFNVFGSYTKKKKKPTKLEQLVEKAEHANADAKTAKRLLAEARTKASKMEIESLERKYKNATDAAEHAKSVATAAAIAKKRENNNAALEAALEKIEENRERNEEEAEKRIAITVPVMKTEVQKAFEKEFEEKEAAKTAAAASRMTKRNAQRIKNETRKLRINNIAGQTSVKRKDVEALLNNVNALELELNSEEIAHIITLAAKAKVDIEDVLALIGSRLVYGSEENAITFLQFAHKQELDLEALIREFEKKKIPFEVVAALVDDIPKNRSLSEAEIVYVLDLAHIADVPVDVALDLYDEESVKTPLTKNQRIKLMRLAYLSGVGIETLLHPTNSWTNEQNISNAEDLLKQMKKNGKTFAQFMHEKRGKNMRNMEEAKARANARVIANRTKLINTLKNKTEKVERPTYKSVAAKRIDEVKDTYTGLKVNNLPIKDIVIHSKKDLNAIADILRGCFRSGIFGKKKGIPEIKTVYIPLEKGSKFPKGYAFIIYQTHEGAKRAFDHMKNPETKKPTFGKTGYEIKGKDVAPAYGEEFFKYSDDKA